MFMLLSESQSYARIRGVTTLIVIISLLILAYITVNRDLRLGPAVGKKCQQSCSAEFVESIPTGLNFSSGPVHRHTHEAWIDLLSNANKSIHIAALYWNLNSTEYPTAEYGRLVYEQLAKAGRRGVKVRTVNFTRLLGSGVLHTKFIIVDMKNVYVGSANMDWKSLAEVKELGLHFRNCSCLAEDLEKIFSVYWYLGKEGARIPDQWPERYDTSFNIFSPMEINLDGVETDISISSSPALFNTKRRDHDLKAIISLISSATRSVCVSVMDLIPQTLYLGSNNSYWPDIDDALRAAAFRGVSVRLLVSHWNHSRPEEKVFLRSLVAINDALPRTRHGKKLFTVASTEEQERIPFARVNHNKYMVTDQTAYVGTSNWAGDYFINTAGVGVAMSSHGENGTVQQLQAIFDRDWNSQFASDL
ncbi:phospholipase D domain protein [Oesophagostomum dentatum]|uniref:Phospholipase D domain protein n=1 Tax=Oesophagostomum dentatum TaxID=61180 RepID=A0A0B1TJ47_OESDE|nr:phospholipase D domain protein [Oesophagostomum dentatum]